MNCRVGIDVLTRIGGRFVFPVASRSPCCREVTALQSCNVYTMQYKFHSAVVPRHSRTQAAHELPEASRIYSHRAWTIFHREACVVVLCLEFRTLLIIVSVWKEAYCR